MQCILQRAVNSQTQCLGRNCIASMMSRKPASEEEMFRTGTCRRGKSACLGVFHDAASTHTGWPKSVRGAFARLGDTDVATAAAIPVDYAIAKRLFQFLRYLYVFNVRLDLFPDQSLKIFALPKVHFDRWFARFALGHIESPSARFDVGSSSRTEMNTTFVLSVVLLT